MYLPQFDSSLLTLPYVEECLEAAEDEKYLQSHRISANKFIIVDEI